jgi:hypothetical protein
MKAFHSGREAKEFLVSELVTEAQRDKVPLTEVERKMLYFTESGWTLPDIMKVCEDFDREYDQAKYEKKIAKLVTKADRRIRKSSRDEYGRWRDAIRFLQREDHYISVMIRLAGLRARGDQSRLFATGLLIASCLLVWTFLGIKYNFPVPSRGNLQVFVWTVLCLTFVAYTLLRFILGRKRRDELTSKVLEKLGRIWQRVGGTGRLS